MTWESAQAGNRAGKTRRYLQWLDTESERGVATAAAQQNQCDYAFLCKVTDTVARYISNNMITTRKPSHNMPSMRQQQQADEVAFHHLAQHIP